MKHVFLHWVPTLGYIFMTVILLGPVLLWLPCSPLAISAQAAAPITPSGLNTQVNLSAIPPTGKTQYDITGGTRPGGGANLFHSFGDFNVPTNNIASFLNETGLPTSNILGRVTGGNISNIFGTIQTTNFGNANLFLMNPTGFLFGPNATVNVGGMMTFTTADYIRLADGGRFNANPNAIPGDLLTAAPVAAFGFLGSNPAAITFEGGQLTIMEGTGLSLIGGNITLMSDSVGLPSSITAPGRSIQLTSVAGPGEVAADTGIPSAGVPLGTVTLGQGTTLSTVNDLSFGDGSGGAISIRGGQIVTTVATILTNPAFGSIGQGGAVMIAATENVSFTNSTIDTSSFSTNGGGSVRMTGSNLSLQDTAITTGVFGDGSTPITGGGGAVTLTGTESVTLTRSIIQTDSVLSSGNGGPVTITAPIVSLEDASSITTSALGDGITPIIGNSGAVTLIGTTSVSLQRSSISTESFSSEGNSGAVTIIAPTVTIAGNPNTPGAGILSGTHNFSEDPNAGNGGDIVITATKTNVTLTDFAHLESTVEGPGSFGRKGGDIRIHGAQNILLDNGTSLLTSTGGQGNAGNIELVSPHVTIRGQSTLASSTFALESGGTIKIIGIERIALESGSTIFTTAEGGSQGPAGHIEINAPQVAIIGGSRLRSDGFGSGPGGTITVQGTASPAQSVLIDGAGSGIFSTTQGAGAGGNTFVNASSVTLQNGASISASTIGTGNAGNIMINAGNHFTMTNSTMTTEANESSGGTIKIATNPSGTVQLTNSTISASVLDGTGGGGSVNIDPQFVILQNSQILAKAVRGPGGNIFITTNLLLPDASSVISASSQFGQNGTITIQSPISPASGKIIPLSQKPLIATALLSQRCAALAGGEFSSFTVAGRDNLPAEPGGWLSSPLALSISKSSGGTMTEARSGMIADEQAGETPLLSLRQISPPGFLTQAFAVDWSAGCTS